MSSGSLHKIIIIAGPNGAGKTTFAKNYLTAEGNCPDFINADLIAAGLSPFAPQRAAMEAGKILLRQIQKRVEAKETFAFETTLSGMGYARHIPQWQKAGYRVQLIFLRLPNVAMAIKRVRLRVLQGGHDIPKEVISRRFKSGLGNFEKVYKNIVDDWRLYDNSSTVPRLLDSEMNQ